MSKKEDKVEQFFNQWWIGDLPKEGFNKTAMLDFAQLYTQSQVDKATSELVEAVKRVLPLAMKLRSIVSISNRESKQIQFAENALRRATLKQHKDKFTSFDGTDQSFITGLEEHNPPEL